MGLLLSLPALALRALWHRQKALHVDATTCFDARTQRALRNRWVIMCGWHVVGCFFGFIQLIMHAVLALHRTSGFRNMQDAMKLHGHHGRAGMAFGGMHPFMMHHHGV